MSKRHDKALLSMLNFGDDNKLISLKKEDFEEFYFLVIEDHACVSLDTMQITSELTFNKQPICWHKQQTVGHH